VASQERFGAAKEYLGAAKNSENALLQTVLYYYMNTIPVIWKIYKKYSSLGMVLF
jgi:hypothetical protein